MNVSFLRTCSCAIVYCAFLAVRILLCEYYCATVTAQLLLRNHYYALITALTAHSKGCMKGVFSAGEYFFCSWDSRNQCEFRVRCPAICPRLMGSVIGVRPCAHQKLSRSDSPLTHPALEFPPRLQFLSTHAHHADAQGTVEEVQGLQAIEPPQPRMARQDH